MGGEKGTMYERIQFLNIFKNDIFISFSHNSRKMRFKEIGNLHKVRKLRSLKAKYSGTKAYAAAKGKIFPITLV